MEISYRNYSYAYTPEGYNLVDQTHYKMHQKPTYVLSNKDKKFILEFYEQSNNVIKKILFDDFLCVSVNAKVGDVICTVDKHLKTYRLVVAN